MLNFIVLVLCLLSVFQGSQSRGINPVTDEVLEVFEALRRGDVQSVENSSVSVNSQDDHAYTLLMVAADRGDEKMVEMLLKNGAEVNKYDWLNKFTPLHLAIKNGHEKVVDLLVKNGADVNLPDNYGNLPMHDAAQYGYDKIAELLFSHGAAKSVNHKRYSGYTPLCSASYNGGYSEGHNKVVEMLIKNGADVNVRCGQGQTPLHLAADKARGKIVEQLLQNGADATIKDENGKTALDLIKDEDGESYEKVRDILTDHEQQCIGLSCLGISND